MLLCVSFYCFFFKKKTAYEMRSSDWSSDVCSSDLQGMSVLLTEADFYDLTLAYLRRVAQDTVRHTEIFFDPQGHTGRGIAFATVFEGIEKEIGRAHV